MNSNDRETSPGMGYQDEHKADVILPVCRLHPDAVLPDIAYNGTSACFDLYSPSDFVVSARGSYSVDLGIGMVVPEGWEVVLRDKSGFGVKKDIQIHCGTIDHGFLGSVALKMYNHGNRDCVVERGMKVAQCAIRRVPAVKIMEIPKESFEALTSERGMNGFGSSDVKFKSKVG